MENTHLEEGKLVEIGRHTAEIIHCIRNPLTGILAHTELLLQHPGCDEFVRQRLHKIHEAAESCERLLRKALETARAHHISVMGDVNRAVRKCEEMLLPRLKASGVELSIRLNESAPLVKCAPDDLEIVLGNLLENAAEALADHPEPRRIEVTSTVSRENVLLVISDNGPGIPAEHLNRIFDPFFTTRAEKGGTGLGLSLCREIVEAAGGRIEVQSAPGQGATFCIMLPIAS